MNKVHVLIAALCAIVFASCGLDGPSPTAEASPGATGSVAMTNFKLNIPSVAPYVVMSKDGYSPRPAGGRAFLGASKVRFSIYESGYWSGYYVHTGLRGSWDIEKTISADKLSAASTSISIMIPTGTFFSQLYIYNSNVSIDTPVASYYSGYDHFTITLAGPNEFSFVLTPTSTRISPNGTTSLYETTGEYTLGQYGETWFVFLNRTETTDVVCTTTAGDADIYVFDAATNALVGSSTAAGTAQDVVSITQGATEQRDYYIGVWGFLPGTTFTILPAEATAQGTITGQ